VAVKSDRAFLAGARGIAIVDLTNQAQPDIVTELFLPALTLGIEVEDELVYVASQDGLRVFRMSQEDALGEMGRLGVSGVRAFVRVGSWAYLLGDLSGLPGTRLLAVDLANPTGPQIHGSYRLGINQPISLVMSSNLAVILSGNSDEIEIVEVRNGDRFVQVGRMRFPLDPFIEALTLDEQQLYMASGGDIRIFNVASGSPHQIGNCTACYQRTGLVSYLLPVGDLLVVTGVGLRTMGLGDLLIYALSNLGRPAFCGYLRLDDPAGINIPTTVEVVGGRAYLGEGWPPRWNTILERPRIKAGFRIIDITNPVAPRELAYVSAGDSVVSGP
jgi:hypothetical protein